MYLNYIHSEIWLILLLLSVRVTTSAHQLPPLVPDLYWALSRSPTPPPAAGIVKLHSTREERYFNNNTNTHSHKHHGENRIPQATAYYVGKDSACSLNWVVGWNFILFHICNLILVSTTTGPRTSNWARLMMIGANLESSLVAKTDSQFCSLFIPVVELSNTISVEGVVCGHH